MKRIVILGGGIAGLYTAYYLLDNRVPGENITLVSKEWPPYTRHRLIHALHARNPDGLRLKIAGILLEKNVHILPGYEAIGVNTADKSVTVRGPDSTTRRINYDILVLALGGKPFIPPIPGLDKPNVSTYHGLRDFVKTLGLPRGSRITIIGGGVIGASLAALLRLLGYRVSIVEIMDHLIPGLLAEPLSKRIEEYMSEIGVEVYTSTRAEEAVGTGRAEALRTSRGTIRTDHIIVATGVRPNTGILKDTGIPMQRGAIIIDDHGRVNGYEDIYALGDCALSKDYVSGKLVYRPLGFIAGKYAKIIASNIAGQDVKCRGIIPTVYEDIGEMKIHVIGLSPLEAGRLGYNYTVKLNDHRKGGIEALLEQDDLLLNVYCLMELNPHFHQEMKE
jgi:NADH oxidase (H2O2-forming)